METKEKNLFNIYTESSPNPNSMKFCVDGVMLVSESVDFPNVQSSENFPIVKDLFRFSFVKRVFISSNFITITKSDDMEWVGIIPMLKSFIKGYMEEGKPLFNEKPVFTNQVMEGDSEIVTRIKILLDEYIKPAVEQDGGAIHFKSFDNGKVTVSLQGSCSGCPSSTITLKAGIENLFKKMIPEVTEVVADAD